MHIVHRGHLDKEIGQNVSDITHIQVETEISAPFQWCQQYSLVINYMDRLVGWGSCSSFRLYYYLR